MYVDITVAAARRCCCCTSRCRKGGEVLVCVGRRRRNGDARCPRNFSDVFRKTEKSYVYTVMKKRVRIRMSALIWGWHFDAASEGPQNDHRMSVSMADATRCKLDGISCLAVDFMMIMTAPRLPAKERCWPNQTSAKERCCLNQTLAKERCWPNQRSFLLRSLGRTEKEIFRGSFQLRGSASGQAQEPIQSRLG